MNLLLVKPTPITGEQLQTSIRFGAFLLVFSCAVALFLTQKLQVSSILLMTTTLVAWPLARKPSQGSFWEIASFFYLIFFFFDLLRLSGALAPALVHLFIFILINKIFNLHSTRDFYQLYLLTFLSMLAASSLSVEIEMFYMIVLYIILLIWNIISITLLQEWNREEHTVPFPFSLFSPVFWLVVAASTVITFGTAIGIFFILPRMQLGYFAHLNPGKAQHVSGFSQKVTLGDVARIEEDRGIAMRVRVTGEEEVDMERLYWRGISFDYYDGRNWSSRNLGTRFLYQDASNFFYVPGKSMEDPGSLVKQEFYLEPLDTNIIFGAHRIAKVRGTFRGVSRDNNATLIGMHRPENYEVYSRVVEVSRDSLRRANEEVPEHIKRYYLQLPFRSDEIGQLAQHIAAGSFAAVDRVFAVKEFLEKNYRYTTTDLPQDRKDPIAVFLLQKKTGHCEYFATSMVLLLRYLKIPARPVNGFLQGEYNEIGDFFVVRHADAHSWVEVYLDGTWIPFDPSPRPLPGETSFRLLFSFQKLAESISFFWDRYILIYSGQDQLDALNATRDKYYELSKSLKDQSHNVSGRLADRLRRIWRENRLLLGIGIAIFSLLFFAGRFYSVRRRSRRISSTPILFYREMLSILEKKGFTRAPQVTPSEFLLTIGRKVPPVCREDLTRLTDLFYRSRFGHYLLTPAEQATVRSSLERLEQLRQ